MRAIGPKVSWRGDGGDGGQGGPWHHAKPAHQRDGRPQTHQAVDGGRTAHRAAGILSDAHRGEVGRDAGAGSAGGTGWAARGVIGVSSNAEGGTNVSGGKLAHIGFPQNDGPRFLHLGCDRGVSPRDESLEDHGPIRRRHVAGFDLVLQQNGNAMQGTHRSGRGIRRVQALGFLERAGVDGLDGVQVGPRLVIDLDAVQVEVHQFAASDPLGLECRVDLVNRGFQKMKAFPAHWSPRRLRRRAAGAAGQYQDQGKARYRCGVAHSIAVLAFQPGKPARREIRRSALSIVHPTTSVRDESL